MAKTKWGKSGKTNPYMVFIDDQKRQHKGNPNWPSSDAPISQWVQACDQGWKSLSVEEKDSYKLRASGGQMPGDCNPKASTTAAAPTPSTSQHRIGSPLYQPVGFAPQGRPPLAILSLLPKNNCLTLMSMRRKFDASIVESDQC